MAKPSVPSTTTTKSRPAVPPAMRSAHASEKRGRGSSRSALVIAALATHLAVQGKNLEQHLAELGELYGHFATGQISIRVTELSVIANLMSRLRNDPPAEIDGVAAKFTDLSIATAQLGATDGLRFDLKDGRRVIVRPSGTEPKLKCYLQAIGESKVSAAESLASLHAAMQALLK